MAMKGWEFEKPQMKYQKVKGLVSVIIPIYNTEIFLKECLDSVLQQTFTNWEAILVNDGSTDNSSAICDEYAAKDSRFKVISKKDNEGLLLARKTGLENSSGEYIANLDSDDSYKPEFLEKMYSKITETKADFVWCLKGKPPHISDEEFLSLPASFHLDKPPYQNYNWNDDSLVNVNNVFNYTSGYFQCFVWNKLIKRDIYEKVLFPQVHLVFGEDISQMMQIAYHSKYATRVSECLYIHRIGHSKDASLNNEKFLVSRILGPFVWIKIMKTFFGNSFEISSGFKACCDNAVVYYNQLSKEARVKYGIEGIFDAMFSVI